MVLWPADRVERRETASLIPYARNSRKHSDAQIAQIAASIREWGWTTPVLIDESGGIIAGHARVLAATKLGLGDVPVMIATGWTQAQIRAYVIADNKLTENGEWDDALLRLELDDLSQAGFEIELTGFTSDELAGMMFGSGEAPDGETADDADRGTLLDLVNVTIAEPTHQVERGDHYRLGGRHDLLCAGVIEQWGLWAPLLTDGALFCPYPGVFVPFGSKAKDHPLVMVQPDRYIAGHILDRYVEVHGEGQVLKVAP